MQTLLLLKTSGLPSNAINTVHKHSRCEHLKQIKTTKNTFNPECVPNYGVKPSKCY